MGGIFGGGGSKSKPMAGEQLQEKQKADAAAEKDKGRVDRKAEEQAAALRSRRRRGAGRSLLSPARENAQTGLSSKLGGGD